MKQFLTLVGLSLSLYGTAQTEQPFTISGSLQNISLPVEKMYLSYPGKGGKYVNDSAIVNDGKYQFTGKIEEPALANIRVRYKADATGTPVKMSRTRDIVMLFLSQGAATVTSVDSFSNAKIAGLKTHDEYEKLTAMQKPFDEKSKALSDEYRKARLAKDDVARKAVEAKFEALDEEMKVNVYGAYLKNNASSPIALYVVNQYAGWDIDPAKVEPLFNKLSPAAQQTTSAKSLKDRIEIAKKTAVGQMAMEFIQNDTLGKPIALSSLKGKYLLVDFWASWCGPCRAENPNVVKAYQAYKDKGFHVLGVSLDQPGAKDKWVQAIHDDNLTWTHVSDLKYWENEVAKAYGIRAIPQNLLLDKNGRIVARNVTGDKLTKKLAELMP